MGTRAIKLSQSPRRVPILSFTSCTKQVISIKNNSLYYYILKDILQAKIQYHVQKTMQPVVYRMK